MNRKKIPALILAAAGTAILLATGGVFAVNTVFAAEEISELADHAILQASIDKEIQPVYKRMSYNDAGCTLMLPTGYMASQETPGMYLSEYYPLDSSNIYYSVSENTDTASLETAMDSEEYKQTAEAKFKETYGEEASITSYRMTKTERNGCPSYQIEMSCQVGDMQMDQLVYIIAADKVYTITYSQSADDERMDDFKKSLNTIQVVFDKQA